MNTSTEIQDLVDSWSHFQGELWDSWMNTGRTQPSFLGEDALKQMLEFTEEMGTNALKIQSDFAQTALRLGNPEDARSGFISDYSEQMRGMMDHWLPQYQLTLVLALRLLSRWICIHLDLVSYKSKRKGRSLELYGRGRRLLTRKML